MDIRDRIMTYKGSVELQNELDDDSLVLPTFILQGIEDDVINVCLDVYGNYVCQKLIKYLSKDQMIKFIYLISFDFKRLFKTIPGACIISSVLKVLSAERLCEDQRSRGAQELILRLIELNLNDLIGDLQGSHLLQECYDLFDLTSLKFISQFVIENFYIIATDRYGCCLIKKIIESEFDERETDEKMFELVLDNLSNLVIVLFNRRFCKC